MYVQVTGHTFEVESDTFKLRNIMEAPLLKNKEEIEVRLLPAIRGLADGDTRLTLVLSSQMYISFTVVCRINCVSIA